MKTVSVNDKGFQSIYQKLLRRAEGQDKGVTPVVQTILDSVRQQGDRAVIRYTKQFDRLTLSPQTIRISKKEIIKARAQADPAVVKSLTYARDRIAAFHERQKLSGWSIKKHGIYLAQRVHPLDRVGLYVPGGKAAYPSSVLMNAVPAKVAGCPQVQICTPAPDGQINPYILVAADLAGVTEIYRIGGVQAIGAMAYGTDTVPRVDKIVGPGNRYVAAAKRLVFGQVDIDMIAGPSELLIIADRDANPVYLASDLLSQAEHDEEAVVVLLTPSCPLWEKVSVEMKRQQATLPRKKIVAASLRNHGVTFITRDLHQAITMSNAIAPEHLSLFVKNPFRYLDQIRHAGSVFLGEETPQAVGDYIAGPNHVLPTGGTARFSSPLSVDDFVKKSSVVSYNRAALLAGGDHLIRIAEVEGLTAHANMVRIRKRIEV
jgi:histidinol dehydrogenase